MAQFKPISLCNTFYKIIYKTLANKLKRVIPNIISHFQSAFIQSRQISNNIVIAHEILRFLKSSKSPHHHVAIKLDMNKSFDKVEWSYILRIELKRSSPLWSA